MTLKHTCSEQKGFLENILVKVEVPLLLVLLDGYKALNYSVDGAVRLEMGASGHSAPPIILYTLQQMANQILQKTSFILTLFKNSFLKIK